MDNRCVCSHGSTYRLPPPSLSISSGLPHARHNKVEMRSINNPTVASKCSRERKSHTSVTSNQKLGLIRLSGDSTLTVQIDQKPGLLCKQPSYGYRGRVGRKFRMLFQ